MSPKYVKLSVPQLGQGPCERMVWMAHTRTEAHTKHVYTYRQHDKTSAAADLEDEVVLEHEVGQ